MAIQVQFRRGTTAETASFTGAVGEVTVDTSKNVTVVHNGTTPGGVPQLRQDGANSALASGSASNPTLKFANNSGTGLYSPQAGYVALSGNGNVALIVDSSGNVTFPNNFSILTSFTAASFAPTGNTIPTNGMYLPATNTVGIATNSALRITVDATGGVTLTGTSFLDLPVGTAAQRPVSPSSGMIRFNSDVNQFEGYNGSIWGQLGGGATGGSGDTVFFENSQTVTANYTLTANKNAVSAGPVTINNGITVTVPSGSSWVVV